MSKKKQPTSGKHLTSQGGELYDAGDFRLAIVELNRLGYDIHSATASRNLHRLNLTCKKTQNRFVLECIGHKDWPAKESLHE